MFKIFVRRDEARVLTAPFGPPPADASAAQLRFSIPFYFR
jgi:hypothetical protein